MQLYVDGVSANVVQEAVVHVHHVLGREAVFGFVARHHGGGVQLEQVEGVGAEGGGFTVTQELQRRRRQRDADDLKLQKVLSTLEVESFVKLFWLLFNGGVRFEDVAFGAVGDVSELS